MAYFKYFLGVFVCVAYALFGAPLVTMLLVSGTDSLLDIFWWEIYTGIGMTYFATSEWLVATIMYVQVVIAFGIAIYFLCKIYGGHKETGEGIRTFLYGVLLVGVGVAFTVLQHVYLPMTI